MVDENQDQTLELKMRYIMSSFCTECGTTFGDEAEAFCQACGVARLIVAAPGVVATPSPEQQLQQNQLAPTVEVAHSVYPPQPQQSYQPFQPVFATQPISGLVAPAYMGQAQVAPKSPGVALLASFFIPGLGTLMNGESGKGVMIFLGWFFGLAFFFAFTWLLLIGLLGLPFVFGFFIWGLVDAYSGARKWNARRGIIS